MLKLSPTTLQFCAALVWTLAGVKLLYRGVSIVGSANYAWWIIAVTVLLGFGKAFFLLDRICLKNVDRIRRYAEKVFFLHMFPLRTWLIIGAMIIIGRLLRMCPAGGEWSGLFSLAVGCGLLLASRISWKGWWALKKCGSRVS
jgi:hypothetical protein